MGFPYLLCHIKYFYYPKFHYTTYLFHFHSSFNRCHKTNRTSILSQIFFAVKNESALSRRLQPPSLEETTQSSRLAAVVSCNQTFFGFRLCWELGFLTSIHRDFPFCCNCLGMVWVLLLG
ncbi:hypothetical protein LINPERHAP1_LOCUS26388 [Linum perenne]